ncbi:MAG: DnaJ domain-containing protein [Deltaproteobacteria bacterium]|nr:DnaJ domain-containing protein [Deltaproteobacteria bacterium]
MIPDSLPDHYQVLGVPRGATLEQIKAAYRRKALRLHPDKNASPEAEERFKRCSEAYSVLADATKRAAYDARTQFDHVPESVSDLLNELLGPLRRRRNGRDLRYELELTLEEVAHGARKRISFPVTEVCGACVGRGAAPGGAEACPSCQGRGDLRSGFLSLPKPCPRCGGQGIRVTRACRSCDGVGRVEREKDFVVELAPGTRAGEIRRVPGEGEPGAFGGRAGDLFVTMRHAPHPFLQAQGADVVLELPVSVSTAAVGGTEEVPTLDGPVRLRVPPGTQPGRLLRLRGKGLLDGARRGDQIVKVVVEIPHELTDEQRELLLRVDALSGAEATPRRQAYVQKLRERADGR